MLYRLAAAIVTVGGVILSILQRPRKQTQKKTGLLRHPRVQSPVDRSQVAENVSRHERALDLDRHLPIRVLGDNFARHDARPTTQSLLLTQDDIARYMAGLTLLAPMKSRCRRLHPLSTGGYKR